MNNTFHTIDPLDLKDNPFRLIGKEWMLVTAGTLDAFNMMTASWGTLGELWNRPVALAFVRPQRYTYQFMERADYFTLTFFDTEYRSALNFCGTKSGRDVDKVEATGLTPRAGTTGAVYFDEARLVFECRKLYAQDLGGEHFIVPAVDAEIYPGKDYHRLYVGEILHCLAR